MRAHFAITDFAFSPSGLSVRLVELLEGEPDGAVGLPLVARADSRAFRVKFGVVGHFCVCPEPITTISEQAVKVAEFVYREPDSQYKQQFSWGASKFNFARPRVFNPTMEHYVVYAENYVLNVLAAGEPDIEETTASISSSASA